MRRGRKPQRGRSREATITARFLPEIKSQLIALAEQKGTTVSILVEDFVIEKLSAGAGNLGRKEMRDAIPD